jgi:hypothetical protein
VLAAAKADFQPEFLYTRAKCHARPGHLRQKCRQQPFLAGAQFFAFDAAIEPVGRGFYGQEQKPRK